MAEETAYCVKCRQKTAIKDGVETKMKKQSQNTDKQTNKDNVHIKRRSALRIHRCIPNKIDEHTTKYLFC